MMNIRPRNYKEAVNLKRCLTLQGMISGIDDACIEEVYRFLCANEGNMVSVSSGTLSLRGFNGQVQKSFSVGDTSAYTSILLTAAAMQISRPYTYSGGDSGGSSGNNNNNNNNNNNG